MRLERRSGPTLFVQNVVLLNIVLLNVVIGAARAVTINCGGVNDSAAINAAVGTANATVSLNGTCIATNITPASNVTLSCAGGNGSCTLAKLASDTGNYLIKTQGTTNVTIQGLTLDLNGSQMTTSPNTLVYSQSDTGMQYTNCTFQNSGTSNSTTGGIALYESGVQISGNTFADTILGYQVRVDMGGTNQPVLIQNNHLFGGQYDSIFFTTQGGSIGLATQSVVSGNDIHNPQDGNFGTGAFGNCIVIFQVSGVQVHDNNCQGAAYSGVRINNSNNVQVYNNTINGCRETSMYAEFGAENNQFYNNTITNGNTGINLNNLEDRPTLNTSLIYNYAYGNTINNMAQFGIQLEYDIAHDNTITNTPYGILIGVGSTGSNMTVQNNTITSNSASTVGPMIHAITLSANLTSPTSVISNNPISNTSYASINAWGWGTGQGVGYISNASNATVWMEQWPPLKSTVIFSGVRGMTQINGQSAVVTALGTSVSSITVDDGGAGYSSNPTIVFGSGCSTPPTATPSIANGHLVNVTLTSGGSGCTSVPSATVSGSTTTDPARVHVFAPMTVNLNTSGYSAWQAIPQGRPLPGVEVLSANVAIPDVVQISNQTMTFAQLGSPENGSVVTVPDAQVSNPCVGNGSGALATRSGGKWVCTASVGPFPPTVATAASANPSPVTGTSTNLSVLGADAGGESSLTYTWATTGTPPGGVKFSANGTNAAKNTTVTFTRAGTYNFLVTLKDAQNLTATSPVTVTVKQALSAVNVSPPVVGVPINGTQAFSASGLDQFNQAVSPPPTFTWTVAGGGSISNVGLFTAGASPGTFTVTAASGVEAATAQVTVTNSTNPPPTIAITPSATPSPVTGTSAALSVLGADPGGTESDLTYTWFISPNAPAGVSFSANGTNSAKNTLATFAAAGNYTLQVVVREPGGLTVIPSVNVTVTSTLASVVISPTVSVVFIGGTQVFSAQVFDQFSQAAPVQPTFTWAVLPAAGTMGSDGTFTAANTPGGPYTITATSGGSSGTALVIVIGDGTTGGPLPTPDLSAYDEKTLTIQDQINLVYSNPITAFVWSVSPQATIAGNAGIGVTAQTSAVSGYSTSAPQLKFNALSLDPGQYVITVQAQNGSQMSPTSNAQVTLVQADLDAVQVYPNPWRSDKHQGIDVTFNNLSTNSTIKIFTLSGHLAKTVPTNGATATWDLTNDSGDKVASGIYIYLITDGQGDKVHGKVAVIR